MENTERHDLIRLLTLFEIVRQSICFYNCIRNVREGVELGIDVLKTYIDDIDKGEETIESTADNIIKFVEIRKPIEESEYALDTYNDILHHINYSTDFWDLKEEDKIKLKESADTKHSTFKWMCMFFIQKARLKGIYESIKEDMNSNATTSLERINDFYKELVKFVELVYKMETMIFDSKEEDSLFYLLGKIKPAIDTRDIHKLTHPEGADINFDFFKILKEDEKFFSDIKEKLDVLLQNIDDTQVNISNEISDLMQKMQGKPL